MSPGMGGGEQTASIDAYWAEFMLNTPPPPKKPHNSLVSTRVYVIQTDNMHPQEKHWHKRQRTAANPTCSFRRNL